MQRAPALTEQILPPRWKWAFAVLAGLLALVSYVANLVGNIVVWRSDGMYDDSILAIVRACTIPSALV